MLITAQCACGKRIGVSDALAGRTVKCPKCGGSVLVAPGGGAAAAKGPAGKAAPAPRKGPATPAVTVSPGLIIGGSLAAVVLAVALLLYFGPWKTGSDWAAMAPKAGEEVTDLVMFALQARQSQFLREDGTGTDGPAAAMSIGKAPAIESPAKFIWVPAFSMPKHVLVTGRTSQGGYRGTYDTGNGEIALDIDTGGYSVGGMADMVKATGSMHVVGHAKGGQIVATADGKPLSIYTPKYRGRHGELGD